VFNNPLKEKPVATYIRSVPPCDT